MGPSGISIILFSPLYLAMCLYVIHRSKQQAETQHKRFESLEGASASHSMRANRTRNQFCLRVKKNIHKNREELKKRAAFVFLQQGFESRHLQIIHSDETKLWRQGISNPYCPLFFKQKYPALAYLWKDKIWRARQNADECSGIQDDAGGPQMQSRPSRPLANKPACSYSQRKAMQGGKFLAREKCLEEQLQPNEYREIFPIQAFFLSLSAPEAFSLLKAPSRSLGWLSHTPLVEKEAKAWSISWLNSSKAISKLFYTQSCLSVCAQLRLWLLFLNKLLGSSLIFCPF